MLAGDEAHLPRAVLDVLVILRGCLAELGVSACDFGHDLGLEAFELRAIPQVGLGQLRIDERREDANVGASIELSA